VQFCTHCNSPAPKPLKREQLDAVYFSAAEDALYGSTRAMFKR
jgi:hypothetical protein